MSPMRMYKLRNIKSSAWAVINVRVRCKFYLLFFIFKIFNFFVSFIDIFVDCCNLQLSSGRGASLP